MKTPWAWRGSPSWSSGWRGRGSRRRASSRGAGRAVVATDRKGRRASFQTEVLSLEPQGVRLELGGHAAATFARAAMVVVSPGRALRPARARGRAARGRARGGRDRAGLPPPQGHGGRGHGHQGQVHDHGRPRRDAREAGGDVRVGGNIGEAAHRPRGRARPRDTLFAVEVSSFQLEGIRTLPAARRGLPEPLRRPPRPPRQLRGLRARPRRRIFANQGPDDWAVVNADDPRVLDAGARGPRARAVRVHAAARGRRAGDGAFFDGGQRAACAATGTTRRSSRSPTCSCPGAHLAGDLLAAAAAARAARARPPTPSRRAVRRVPRRRARARARGRRSAASRFFNDSKATNVDAARKSLEAFAGPVLADPRRPLQGRRLRRARARRCATAARRVLAIGEAQERIAASLGGASCRSCRCDVAAGGGGARLAPWPRPATPCCWPRPARPSTCSEDYADRGRAFKDEVRRLAAAAERRAWLRSSPPTARSSPSPWPSSASAW